VLGRWSWRLLSFLSSARVTDTGLASARRSDEALCVLFPPLSGWDGHSTWRQAEVAPNDIAGPDCRSADGLELSGLFRKAGYGLLAHRVQILYDDAVVGDQRPNVGCRLASDGDAHYRVVERSQLGCIGVARANCLADLGVD